MTQEDCRAELRERTHQLLQGALKHVRVAALATALVPLGAVAARPAVAQQCGSGGCPVTETPTVEATEAPTDTPDETPTYTFTWTPEDTVTETETPTPTDTPTVLPDTPTQTAADTETPTATPPDTVTETATHTAVPTDTFVPLPTDTSPPPPTSTPVNTVTQTLAPTNTSVPTRTSTPTQTPTPTNEPCRRVSISSRFSRDPIAAGNCIWFSSVIDPTRLRGGPTTIVIDNQTVRFRANGHTYLVNVPRGVVTFDRNVTSATTTFDPIGNQWVTEVPWSINRDVFAAGVMLPVTSRLPGGIEPVTWSASFSSDTDRVRLEWQWAAAVYTRCDTPLAALGVKPVDGNARNPYRNNDDAGTPEAIKRFVVDGARSDGGHDYTGSGTRSEFVRPCD